MRLAAEHPRVAGAAAIGLVVLVMSAALVARATVGRTATVPPGVGTQLAQIERQNAQLEGEAQRQAGQLVAQRARALILTARLGNARAEPGRASPTRGGSRHR